MRIAMRTSCTESEGPDRAELCAALARGLARMIEPMLKPDAGAGLEESLRRAIRSALRGDDCKRAARRAVQWWRGDGPHGPRGPEAA
jgi:hypothetical protein